MDKPKRNRYIIVIYVIVLCVAIILWLIAYYQNLHADWKATQLNLSTELLGIVLVFFVVDRLFLADDRNNDAHGLCAGEIH